MASKKTVQEYIYKPRGHWANPNHKNDKSRCEHEVSDHDSRMASYSQCSRKSVEFIDGVGFCKAHAVEVNRGLGRLKGTITKFVAKFEYGQPALTKVLAVSETEKRIDIQSSEDLIGHIFLLQGVQNKNGQFFDDWQSAITWLITAAEEKIEFNRIKLNESIEHLRMLEEFEDSI